MSSQAIMAKKPLQKQSTKKLSTARKNTSPLISLEANLNYSAKTAAQAFGVSIPTIWRAIYSEHLKHYRIGSRVVISGQQLIDWRDAGGKTGYSAK